MSKKCLGLSLFFAATLSACIFFTVESDLYIQNATSHSLTVSLTDYDNDITEIDIEPQARVKITTFQLLEADVAFPSNAYRSLRVFMDIYNSPYKVYEQDPINDELWIKTPGSSSRFTIFDFTLTDALLTLPE